MRKKGEEKKGEEKTLNMNRLGLMNVAFLLGEWILQLHSRMFAKCDIDQRDFYFDATLHATAVSALPADVYRVKRGESEKKLKSILIFVYEMECKKPSRRSIRG